VRLFLVRHAEAAPGEEIAPEKPSAIVSSPLLRARETAELIAQAAGVDPRADDRLAPGATADDVKEAVADSGETVVAVGHQPDCSTIVLELTGRRVSFAPGAVHLVEL
jgi:phosphohistidine phosphatase